MGILCRHRLVLGGKAHLEIPESSWLGISENICASKFIFSDAENNTSGPVNRGAKVDLLSLRTLLAIG